MARAARGTAHLAELEQDAILLLRHQLKVLDGSLCDTAAEVEAVGAELVIPPRRLVEQGDDVIRKVLPLGPAMPRSTFRNCRLYKGAMMRCRLAHS